MTTASDNLVVGQRTSIINVGDTLTSMLSEFQMMRLALVSMACANADAKPSDFDPDKFVM
jgi:hypothetical protein